MKRVVFLGIMLAMSLGCAAQIVNIHRIHLEKVNSQSLTDSIMKYAVSNNHVDLRYVYDPADIYDLGHIKTKGEKHSFYLFSMPSQYATPMWWILYASAKDGLQYFEYEQMYGLILRLFALPQWQLHAKEIMSIVTRLLSCSDDFKTEFFDINHGDDVYHYSLSVGYAVGVKEVRGYEGIFQRMGKRTEYVDGIKARCAKPNANLQNRITDWIMFNYGKDESTFRLYDIGWLNKAGKVYLLLSKANGNGVCNYDFIIENKGKCHFYYTPDASFALLKYFLDGADGTCQKDCLKCIELLCRIHLYYYSE